MSPTLEAEGSIACAIFSHLEHPRDRIALAAVSRVFRDAEKSDASLPGGLSALKRLTDKFHNETKFAEALYWYRKGADRGDAGYATSNLAEYCEEGDGVDKDEAKAVELYVKAAGLGHSLSAQRLGAYYEHGKCGVAVDKKEALKWYRVAVELGYTYAKISHADKSHVDRLELELAATHTN
jgi:TPR repeat protein